MNKKKSRFLTTLLAVMLCMTAFSSVAYAGGEELISPPTTTSTPSPSPFIPGGTSTVLDNATDEDGKEFFTIITPNEHVFYLVIDRQRNTENVYFLDAVTEKDLLALAETSEVEELVISTPTPEPAPQPTVQPQQKQQAEPEPQNNISGIITTVLIVAVIAGGVFLFFKFRKSKQSAKGKTDLDDYDFGEDEDYEAELPSTNLDKPDASGAETEDNE